MLLNSLTCNPLLSLRNTSQDPQWITETTDNTESYIYYYFSHTYVSMIKFNL